MTNEEFMSMFEQRLIDGNTGRPDVIGLLKRAQTAREEEQLQAALRTVEAFLKVLTEQKPTEERLYDISAENALQLWDLWLDMTILKLHSPQRFNKQFIRREFVGDLDELLQTKANAPMTLMFNAFLGGLDMSGELLRMDRLTHDNQ